MTKRLTIALVALALFVLVAVMPVSADYASNQLYYVVNANVTQGASVFIGEQGLNISPAVAGANAATGNTPASNTTIGWWASAASITNTAPSQTYSLTSVLGGYSFQVPNTWSAYTGPWYLVNQNTGFATGPAVFTVQDPSLDVAVYDPVAQVDDTGKSVVQGTVLAFKITDNMYTALASNRNNGIPTSSGIFNMFPGTGANTSGYIDIRVKTPAGALLTQVYNDSVSGSTQNTAEGASGAAHGQLMSMTAMNVSTPTWIWGIAAGSVANSTSGTTSTGAVNFNTGTFGNWSTGATDSSGQQAYPAGTYTVYAQSKLNNMYSNYPNQGAAYTGKTVTQSYTVTLVSNTVTIQANVDTVVRSKSFSVTVTGKPNQLYHLWVTGTSSLSGGYDDQPPYMAAGQSHVTFDTVAQLQTAQGAGLTTSGTYAATYGAGYLGANATDYAYQNGANALVGQDIPTASSTNVANFGSINQVAATVLTSATDGTITVGFSTTNWTKAQKYTIRAEQNFSGQYKSDSVDVTVQKGAVTITAAGSQSYYLGEEIDFSGTNTESYNTYLFIVGPNLDVNGASLFDPHTAIDSQVTGKEWVIAAVNGDNTWSYKWGTQAIDLDAGTYTIYAASQPVDASSRTTATNGVVGLNNVAYGTVSIIIKKPFISATASQSTVAQGDRIYITGTAQGNPTPGIAIWILGKNYALYTTTAVNSDASFSYEFKQSMTKNLAAGQYFVVAQHPMQNNVFDIVPVGDSSAVTSGQLSGNVWVVNKALNGVTTSGSATTTTNGTQEFKVSGSGSLQGSDAAEALVTAIDDPSVDDTYTKLQFTVEVPYININPIGDKNVGDKFTVTANTNLAVGDDVLVQIYSSSFKPTQKSQSGEFSGATGTVQVTAGTSGENVVSFDVDSSTFKPDEYIVEMTGVLQTATGTALFNVLEAAPPTATPTAMVTAAPVMTTAAPTVPPTEVPTQIPTTKSPGYGALIALIGLGAVAFIVVRRH